MKILVLSIMMSLGVSYSGACSERETAVERETSDSKILVAYFSWGGTTQQVAQKIAQHTRADTFRIETVNEYPTDYTACTEVAKVERDEGIRPDLKAVVENMEDYDIIFVGCPVWWHTAPMAIWSFLESENYDFKCKTIIPFCTYAATYRDETLAKIVELTPESEHLAGFGTTNRNADVASWLKQIGVISNQ